MTVFSLIGERTVREPAPKGRFGVPISFMPLDLGEGPRPIPRWARDAAINWHWAFDNRPSYAVRCRSDPLAFAKFGWPVWRPFQYETKPGDVGHVGRGRSTGWGWMAEQDGVAVVHYHSGSISMTRFEETVTDDKGRPVWIERPDWRAGNPGKAEQRVVEMLATSKDEGYGGRPFDITLAECEIVIDGKPTVVPAGTNLRLRGPWHGGPPTGFREVTYLIDEREEPWCGRGKRRPWDQRGGHFGLCLRTEVLLDIAATFLPHVEWALTEYEGKGRPGLEPLLPQTRLPKGWPLEPDQCPGHDYVVSPFSTGRDRERPNDRCRFCSEQRDPAWVYVSPFEQERRAKAEAAKAKRTPVWPLSVTVPPAPMRGRIREYRP